MPMKNQPNLIKILILFILAAMLFGITYFANSQPCFKQAKAEETVLGTYFGRVVSPDAENKVLLYGSTDAGSPFYNNVRIEVRDAVSDAVILTINPATNTGYNPNLLLANFSGAATEQIFLGMDSGGSGGYGYYYIYDVSGAQQKTLFDYEKISKQNEFCGKYLPNFRAEVLSCRTNQRYYIDLRCRPSDYLNQIYRTSGKLLAQRTIDVSDVNNVFPYYNSSTRRFELFIYQRITGLYNADLLGYMVTQMKFKDGAFAYAATMLSFFGC